MNTRCVPVPPSMLLRVPHAGCTQFIGTREYGAPEAAGDAWNKRLVPRHAFAKCDGCVTVHLIVIVAPGGALHRTRFLWACCSQSWCNNGTRFTSLLLPLPLSIPPCLRSKWCTGRRSKPRSGPLLGTLHLTLAKLYVYTRPHRALAPHRRKQKD